MKYRAKVELYDDADVRVGVWWTDEIEDTMPLRVWYWKLSGLFDEVRLALTERFR